MINKCPECNQTIGNDRQSFCDQCGFDLRSAVDAGGAPVVSDSSQTAQKDAENYAINAANEPPHRELSVYSQLDDQARQQFYLEKLQEAWAGGNITPEEMQELSSLRRELQLSDEQADKLSQKAIESLRPPHKDDLAQTANKPNSRGVCLSVNSNSFFMEGLRGILHMKVENLSDMSFNSVKIELSGDLIGRNEQCSGQLKAGKAFKRRIGVKPEDAGVNLVKFRVTARCGDEIYAFWAEEDFPVFRETKDLRQISIQADKFIDNSVAENSKSMGNAVKSQIGSLFHFDKIKDANDLMQEFRNLQPVFKLIELEYDPERSEQLKKSLTASDIKAKRIVQPHRGTVTHTASLCAKEKDRATNIVLVAKPLVKLGKKRDNDIVTRFCPRNPINDKKTNQISRTHCMLELKDGRLWIKDCKSANGTIFDGDTVGEDGAICKGQAKELELGGVMKLNVDCIGGIRKVDWRNYESLMDTANEPLWNSGLNPGLNAVCLQRRNNLGPRDHSGQEEYLIIYRVAAIGAGHGCAICFEQMGLEPLHAAIVAMNGKFYLENLTNLTDVFVNSVTISRNELMPLEFGDKLLIGRLQLEFKQKMQLCTKLR